MEAIELGELSDDLERAIEDALAPYSLVEEGMNVARESAKAVVQFLLENGMIVDE